MAEEIKTADAPATPVETVKETPAAEAPATPAAAAPTETPPAKVEDKTAVEAVVDPAKVEEKPVAPEKYELKLGKNSSLDSADLAKIEAAAKAQGLSQDDAQKLLASKESEFSDYRTRYESKQQELMRSQQKSWVDEIQADKEIGGKAFKENIETAHRGLARFADESFTKLLNESGLGNNPHLIRTFYRIGKAMANDKAVLDGKAGAPAKKVSRESKLYPSHTKTEE